MTERRLIERDGIEALEPAWRELAARAARTPFESPTWLVPWIRHYGRGGRPIVVTWWRGSELVGIAPLIGRRRRSLGVLIRDLEFWGRTATPLAGWVDLVADEDVAPEVAADLVTWLAERDAAWDLFHYLHLDQASPLLAALDAARAPWRRVDHTGVLHSLEYELALPGDGSSWRGPLGPKARRETEREMRLFERRVDGRVAWVQDPGEAGPVVEALGSLMAAAWGDREAYFRRDPRFRPFLEEALARALEEGLGWVHEARDPQGVAACLVTLIMRERAVATLIGVSRQEAYRPMSLGKGLFHEAILAAAAQGCRQFSFLTESDEYKRTFWGASGRPLESGLLARGARGAAVAAAVMARRAVLGRLRDRGGAGPGSTAAVVGGSAAVVGGSARALTPW